MATNNFARFLKALNGDTLPLTVPGNFAAGSTQVIKAGEIIELTGNTNTEWVPIDSDFNGAGNVAIAAVEIKAGDRAGYYPIIVPRPGDVFDFALASASNPSLGDLLYYSSSEAVATSGSNSLGNVASHDHYPPYQGHLEDDASPDQGTTIKSTSRVGMCFDLAASYYAALVL